MVAITNNRILSIRNGQVTFRYKYSGNKKKKWKSSWKTMTLPVMEFIARFLQHVPPKGFHKVRYYGLLGPANRPLLRQIQLLLAADPRAMKIVPPASMGESKDTNQPRTCCSCKKGIMVGVDVLPRIFAAPFTPPARSPP